MIRYGTLTTPLDISDGAPHLTDKPSLGVELDIDFTRAHPDPEWQG